MMEDQAAVDSTILTSDLRRKTVFKSYTGVFFKSYTGVFKCGCGMVMDC